MDNPGRVTWFERRISDMRKEIDNLTTQLAEARQEIERLRKSVAYDTQKAMDEVCKENERLRAEVERRTLPRGTGTVSKVGHYWIKTPQGWALTKARPCWSDPEEMEWAGPILPPEEEK